MNSISSFTDSGMLLADESRVIAGGHSPEIRTPVITVIVPVYNEVRTVAELLDAVALEPTPKEIVIVDDGSTDGTAQRLQTWAQCLQSQTENGSVRRIVLLRHALNQGKGAAIRTALHQANAEFVIVQDADLEVSPSEYPSLIKPLLAGEADIVIGFRMLSSVVPRRLAHSAGIRLLNLLVRFLYGVSVRDEACCFKVLRARDLRRMQLKCTRFEFCPEVVAKAARSGLRFVEVPVAYAPRDSGGGKKLKLSDGLSAIWTLWKYRRWRME